MPDPQETFLATPAFVGLTRSGHPRQTARHARGRSRQLIEQPLRFFQIGGVEAFGEPSVNRREQLARFRATTPFPPQPREARCRAQLIGRRLAVSRDAQRFF